MKNFSKVFSALIVLTLLLSSVSVMATATNNFDLGYDATADWFPNLPTIADLEAVKPNIASISATKATSVEDLQNAGGTGKGLANYISDEFDTYVLSVTVDNINDLAVSYSESNWKNKHGVTLAAVVVSADIPTTTAGLFNADYLVGTTTIGEKSGAFGFVNNGETSTMSITVGDAVNKENTAAKFAYPGYDKDDNGAGVESPVITGNIIICVSKDASISFDTAQVSAIYVIHDADGEYKTQIANAVNAQSKNVQIGEAAPTTYTVNFKKNDGTDATVGGAQTVEEGKYATAPADPSREGYTFEGWALSAAPTTVVNVASTPITANTDFVAVWKEIPPAKTDATYTAGTAGAAELTGKNGQVYTNVWSNKYTVTPGTKTITAVKLMFTGTGKNFTVNDLGWSGSGSIEFNIAVVGAPVTAATTLDFTYTAE